MTTLKTGPGVVLVVLVVVLVVLGVVFLVLVAVVAPLITSVVTSYDQKTKKLMSIRLTSIRF